MMGVPATLASQHPPKLTERAGARVVQTQRVATETRPLPNLGANLALQAAKAEEWMEVT